jgi:hypothetical protein
MMGLKYLYIHLDILYGYQILHQEDPLHLGLDLVDLGQDLVGLGQ